ncbi:acetyltransferase [Halorubrum coriense DSM 10284]|uniref:Acetyltransferase n=1 Tax=Halorubrum coriense DSM 10284 TaxID=1227466 RepID=M0E831_9EURY|nr:GNAT family N-acetyltransferase [Halorubrum coriense]ELZ43940.1 acetyltransferase [Halorubrum coriense DSM 10284]
MTPTVRRLREGTCDRWSRTCGRRSPGRWSRSPDRNALADDVNLVAAGVEHRRDRLDDEGAVTWVAVGDGGTSDDGRLVGYAAASVASSAPVFAAGDRLHVGELSVREPYRGEGVAGDLLDRVDAA